MATFATNSKWCYIISSNVKLENIILNIKIRTRYLKSCISVFSSGFSFSANFPNIFITLNLKSLLKFFESKSFFSLQYIKEINP